MKKDHSLRNKAESFPKIPTERKKAEEKMAWQSSFPELNPNPIIEVDQVGQVHYLNRAAKLLFPDLQNAGFQHQLFADMGSIFAKFQKKEEISVVREVQVGETWYQETLYYIEEIQRVRIYCLDITKYKRVQDELKHNEEYFRSLIENSSDIVVILNPDGIMKYVSPSIERTLGYKPDDLIAKNAFEFIHHGDVPKTISALNLTIQNPGEVKSAEFRFLHKDGSWRFLEARGKSILETSGMHVVINSRDITEHKRSAELIMESEQRYRHLVESVTDYIYTVQVENGRSVSTSHGSACVAVTGYISAEYKADENLWYRMIHSEDRHLVMEQITKVLSGVTVPPLEHRIIHKDGSIRWVRSTLVPRYDENGCLISYDGMISDVTERKQAENALCENQARFDLALRSAGMGVWHWDIIENKRYFDDQVCHLLGINPVMFTGTAEEFFGAVHPDDREMIKAALARTIEQDVLYEPEYRVVWPDGSVHYITARGGLVRDDKGRPVRINGIIWDITERKRTEDLMETLRRHNELILNSAAEGIIGLDLQGNQTFVNPSAAGMLGYEVEELIGKHSHSIWHHLKTDGNTYPEDECPIYETLKDGAVHHNVRDEVFWRKDGTSFPVAYSSTPIMDKDKIVGAVVNFRDITERKHAEEQLKYQLDRIAALRDIDRAITSSFDLRLTLKVIIEEVTKQLRVDAADVLLFNQYLQILEYAAGLGFRTSALQHTRLPLGKGHAGQSAIERRIICIPNLSETSSDFTRAPLFAKEEFVSYYAVPLITKGQIKGVLEIFHRSRLEADTDWFDFLDSLATQAAIAIDNAELFNSLQRSNIDLIMAYDATIEGWARALDYRDRETEGHSRRVTEMTMKIAQAIGVSETELLHVRRGALLHDIGKMGIPDSILLKPGKLTDEEWEIMRKHPVFAYDLLSPIGFLRPALDIPYCHHEKWDGTGYPRGLKGEQIPLSARIFSVVDVWDALRSDRPYRPAWAEEKAKEYIQQLAGKEFDPKVVEAFLKIENE